MNRWMDGRVSPLLFLGIVIFEFALYRFNRPKAHSRINNAFILRFYFLLLLLSIVGDSTTLKNRSTFIWLFIFSLDALEARQQQPPAQK